MTRHCMPNFEVPDEIIQELAAEQFPRASSYDLAWVIENSMGPNVLWMTEYVTQAVTLEPGMRVLDLGCGRAASSIFLAREFGVQVWAADLWIDASDNLRRIEDAGLQAQIFPIHTEAHALPFAEEFFDAIVSVDAYHYFGTDDLYLGYLARFVKPGGQIGIAVPGLTEEIGSVIPEELVAHWYWDFASFHSAGWWQTHWERTGLMEGVNSELLPGGGELWLRWESAAEVGKPGRSDGDLLRADVHRRLGFVRLTGRRAKVQRYRS